MRQETVQAVDGQSITTESGEKICIGNHAFDVGEAVWTDGRYAFGNDRRSTNIVPGDGSGIIGDYFVFNYHGQWRIYSVNNLSYYTIDDGLAFTGHYFHFYSKDGTRFCACDNYLGGQTFTYYELTSSGLVTKTLDLSSYFTDGTYYLPLIDCYYDDSDKIVFKFINMPYSGVKFRICFADGTVLDDEDTSAHYYCYTFTDGILTNTEEVTAGYAEALVNSGFTSMQNGYTKSNIIFENVSEPTESDVQNYWNIQGDGYTVSDWKEVWKDNFVKDASHSTVHAQYYDGGRLNYSKSCINETLVKVFSTAVKPENALGFSSLVLKTDYANTISAVGFDNGSLDNYYCLSKNSRYISYYGPSVVVPNTPPTGYSILSKWNQDPYGLTSYYETQHCVSNTDYKWQDKGKLSTINDSYSSFYFLMRTAKFTYTLTHNGTAETKTVYWTRTANTIDFVPEEAINEPVKKISQEYHSGWTITINTSTYDLMASKDGTTFAMGTHTNFSFAVSFVPAIIETADSIIFVDHKNCKLVKMIKSTLVQTDILTDVSQFMFEFPILWRIPMAKLVFLLNQKSTT